MPDTPLAVPNSPIKLEFMMGPNITQNHLCEAFTSWSSNMLKEYSYPAGPETLDAIKNRTAAAMDPANFIEVQVPGEYTTKSGEKYSISFKVPEFLAGHFTSE